MKPGFALSLSDERIDLLARTSGGWAHLGAADTASDDLEARMTALRERAAASAPDGFQTKVILPPSQILYAEVSAPGPDAPSRRTQIEAALEGRTPYRVDELVFDWSGDGPVVQVAVVARLTLDEAEGFAEDFDFAPVAFVTVPEPGQFAGEPFFGPTRRQAAHLPAGAIFERDADPVRLNLPPLAAPDAADMVEEDGVTATEPVAEPAPEPVPARSPEAVPEPVAVAAAEAVAEVEPGAEAESDHPGSDHPEADHPGSDHSEAGEAPFADVSDEGDIFADYDGEWRSVRPVVDDTDAAAEDSPGGAAPVPGFASHRPAALAEANAGAAGLSRLEAITSRIQMTQTRGAAPKAPPAPARAATPPRAQPLRRSPSLPPVDPGAAEAGDTLIRALDRVRAPVGAPVGVAEQRQRHQRNRRMLGTATTAAAVLFAGVVGLWWWYFETRPALPEPQTIAAAPEAAAPAPAPEPAPRPAPEQVVEAAPATDEAAPATAPAAEIAADRAAPPPAETVVEVAPATTSETAPQTAPIPAPQTAPQTAPIPAPIPAPGTVQRAPVAAGPDEPAPSLPALAPAIAANPGPDAEVGRPGAASESAVALTPPAALSASGTELSDRPAPVQPVPTAFGALQRFDADGNIIATAEGVRTPQGFVLLAGRPDNAPPARPAEIQALAAATAPAAAPEPAAPAEALDAAAAPAPADPEPATEVVPQPLDPATAARRPVTRPAAIQPPAPEPVVPEPGATEPSTSEPATSEPSTTAPDDQASAAPPPPDPVTAARRPLARPAAIAAAPAATPETEPAPVVAASRYAVATSPNPTPRPNLLNRAVEQALAAALAEAAPEAPTEAPAEVAAAHEELDEPEPESAAPDIPTTANVAKNATIANAIDLGEMSLIGIVGSAARQRALVRTSKGRILTVTVGDKLDGGKVSGIGDGQLTYVKNGKTHVLKMTNKG